MKTFLLGCFLLTVQFSFAQTNNFAPIGAKWWYSTQDYFPAIHPLTIEVLSDTLIDGNTCSILSFTPNPNYVSDDNDIFLFQDGEIIYQYFPDEGDFYKLYDFSLEAGQDYWCHVLDFDGMLDSVLVEIESVEMVEISGHTLKKQTIKTTGHYDWFGENIEIIGNTQSIIPIHDLMESLQGPLRCYEDPDFELYSTGETTTCDEVLTGISDIKRDDLLIYPNPFSDILNIQVNSDFQESYNIKVYNLLGETCFSSNSCQSNCFLNLSELNSGQYFIEIQMSNSISYYLATKI